MAKKQTRRSISVSGEIYNAVRDYCDKHGLSASGLVTELLERYLVEHKDGPPQVEPDGAAEPARAADRPQADQSATPRSARTVPQVRVGAPPALRDANYPDRRGPGFGGLRSPDELPRWIVTAQIEISRRRRTDAHSSVEVLLQNLMHRRLVNEAHVVKVEPFQEE